MEFQFKIKNSKFIISVLVFLLGAVTADTYAQEKKTVRLVTVSLSWNSALPGRGATSFHPIWSCFIRDAPTSSGRTVALSQPRPW